jgi:two-component system NtrC family sensor kinase
MLQAAQQGQVVQAQDAEGLALAIPLRVRDQVVGVLGFRKGFAHGERQAWTDEERELLASFSAQLESALESARLYQETQRRAAEDRLLGEVTARMRQTLDVETVLQTAVREMGVALGLSRVEVRMSHRGNDHA